VFRGSLPAGVGGGFGPSSFVFAGFAFELLCVVAAAVYGDWVRGGVWGFQVDGSDG